MRKINSLRTGSKRFYTEDYIDNIVKNCSTLREVREKYRGVYDAMCRYKLLDKYPNLKRETNVFIDTKHFVYAYCFEETKTVYVGLTMDIERRNREHLKNLCDNSSVYKYAKNNNIPIPEVKILKENLTPNESAEWEDFYVKKFRRDGWNVLNKAKTGVLCGSLGTIGNDKLTRSYCYREAQKYTILKDFRKFSNTAYQKACAKKWLDDYLWLFKDCKTQERQVLLFDKEGKCVGCFKSVGKSASYIGVCRKAVSNNLNGRSVKIKGRYFAKYQDDYLADWWEENMENIAA